MLSYWLRNFLLWTSRLLGTVQRLLWRPVVFHLLVFMTIAGALWTIDHPDLVRLSAARTWRASVSWLRPAKGAAVHTASPRQGESTLSTESQPSSASPSATKSWLTPWNVLSLWAFGFVAWGVIRARRRLVIAFEDNLGKQSDEQRLDKQTGIDPGGFGVLVAAELASLSSLFSEFEEGRSIQATPEKMKPIDATFQTESAGEFLQNTVSSEAKFSLGPLEIPVGIILGLIGRLVQGPRIVGRVHRDGLQRVITVRLVGSLGTRVWILPDSALASESDQVRWRPAADVASDLACRLFAELAMDRPVTWQALSQFVGGVRAYRRSLQTPKQQKLNLKEAEHRLLQAQADDPAFDLAFYNLGVVYNEQGKPEAALTAFTRAAEKNPQRAGTQYALALINFDLAKMAIGRDEGEAATLYLSQAIQFSDRALELKPPREQLIGILALKSLVYWWRAWRWPPGSGIQFREFRSAGTLARRAILQAWRVLCRIEIGIGVSATSRPYALEQARRLAGRHLETRAEMLLAVANVSGSSPAEVAARNLAQIEASGGDTAGLRRPSRLLLGILRRVSFFLVRTGAKLSSSGRLRRVALRVACYSLRQARGITPDDFSVLLALGQTYLKRGQNQKAIPALQKATQLSPASSEAWAFLARAYAARDHHNEAQEAAQNCLATVSNVSQDSLDALVAALVATRALYSEVQDTVLAIPAQKHSRSQLGFLLWFIPRYFRLGYRIAGREFKALTAANQLLQQLLSSNDALQQVFSSLDGSIQRAKVIATFSESVAALRKKGQEGIEPLKALMAEKQQRRHHWEVGEVGHNLSLLYFSLEQLPEAAKCLGDTITYLEKTLHNEIKRRGLYTLLGRILRRQGTSSRAIALEQAKKGVAWDPINSYERIELGWVYWSLSDFLSAQSVWEDVLLLAPDRPQVYVNLGLLHLAQLGDATDRAARNALIRSSTLRLKSAVDLFDETDEGRSEARWLLSQTYSSDGQYGDAIRELRALEGIGYCPLAIEISLADAYLSSENWSAAELRFRKAAVNVDKAIQSAAQGFNEVPDSPLMFEQSLGTISAWAHLGIASSLAQREILLDQAFEEIALARSSLAALSSEEMKKQWEANCLFHEGFVLFKRDQVDEAIDRLAEALAVRVESEVYFTLAESLRRKTELSDDPGVRNQLTRRATAHYQEALRIDWDGRLTPKIAKALALLESASDTQQPAAERPSTKK
jgi:tetratricopeptide (TPR) repeat protein